uniref:Uncharacterized protein n=1 Tax=Glossina brevipalpis TaxID=37001 RepID=A0A1A9WMV1_9MUSC
MATSAISRPSHFKNITRASHIKKICSCLSFQKQLRVLVISKTAIGVTHEDDAKADKHLEYITQQNIRSDYKYEHLRSQISDQFLYERLKSQISDQIIYKLKLAIRKSIKNVRFSVYRIFFKFLEAALACFVELIAQIKLLNV